MKRINEKGITILALIFWVLVIGAAILYGPKGYQYLVTQYTNKLIIANVENVEAEIRSELLSSHPVHVWNRMDSLINNLRMQNPVALEHQSRNGWDHPGDVVVSFDGINTFRLDGIGRDGSSLRLNIIIQRTS